MAYNNDLQVLFEVMTEKFGYEVGNLIKSEINAVLQTSTVDVAALTAKINTIDTILDGDNADTQSTVTNLISIVQSNASAVTANGEAIAAETAARVTAVNSALAAADDVDVKVGDLANFDSPANDVVEAINNLDAAIQAVADAVPQSEVDAIEAAIGLNNDGTYNTPVGTNYLDSSTSVMNALTLLDNEVNSNAGDIAQEIDDRIAADASQQIAIDSKVAQAEVTAISFAGLSSLIRKGLSEGAAASIAGTYTATGVSTNVGDDVSNQTVDNQGATAVTAGL